MDENFSFKEEQLNKYKSNYLTVEELAKILGIPVQTIYSYTCKSGSQGGKKRKSFPKNLFVKIGRKILFFTDKFFDWLDNGAEFV